MLNSDVSLARDVRGVAAGLWLAAALPAGAQAVSIDAGPIVPFVGINAVKGPRPPGAGHATHEIALYGTAFLGPAGEPMGLPAGQRARFHYVALNLMFSATALPQTDEREIKVAGNLQRLNAHVNIVPLDSLRRPLTDLAALEVLATFPDELLSVQSNPDSTTSRATTAAFRALTRSLLPEVESGVAAGKRVGSVVASFVHGFHRPSARTQIAYVSEHREFGWTWYEQGDQLIEGTHRAGAALEVGSAVRYLEVRIRLIANWRSHGSWQREIRAVLNLGAGAPAQ